MPLITTKPMQLPEDIGMYVDALRKKHPAIGEVWLLGPRVNAEESRGEQWDLLAFADDKVLAAVRGDPASRRDDVRLSVVVDGDRFEAAWGDGKSGRLSDMGWRVEDLHNASYASGAAARASAVRVR